MSPKKRAGKTFRVLVGGVLLHAVLGGCSATSSDGGCDFSGKWTLEERSETRSPCVTNRLGSRLWISQNGKRIVATFPDVGEVHEGEAATTFFAIEWVNDRGGISTFDGRASVDGKSCGNGDRLQGTKFYVARAGCYEETTWVAIRVEG